LNVGDRIKLNDKEIKKAKTMLIITSILGLSIGFVSALLENIYGIILCVFIFIITTYYVIILSKEITSSKQKQQRISHRKPKQQFQK